MIKTLLNRKLQNFVERIHRRRSLILAVLLFVISCATPPVIAITSPTVTVQAQQDGGQLANNATQLYRSGQYEKAAEAWQQTASVFAAQGNKLNLAMALSNLSLTYQKLGKWQQATKAIEQSLEILKTQPQGKEKLTIQAQTLDVQGNLQREMGQSTEALKTWQQATNIYSKINEPEKLAQSKINQAQAMQDLGLYPRACSTLLDALKNKIEKARNCQELGDITSEDLKENLQKVAKEPPSVTTVVGLRSLGELLRIVGQLDQSEMILTTSLTLAQKLKSPQEQAAVYLSLGNTAQALTEGDLVRGRRENNQQKSLAYYSNVVKLSPCATTQQQAQLNQLSLLLNQEEFESAEQLWRSLYPQLMNLSPSRTGVYQQINFAHIFVQSAEKDKFTFNPNPRLPTFNQIAQILATATQQARSLGDKRAEAFALYNRGALSLLAGSTQNLPQAETLTKQGLNIVSSFETPDITYQLLWQLGRIRAAQKNIPDAIASYTKAYIALQSLRSDLITLNPEIQFSFRESVEPVYRQLVDLDLKHAVSLKKAGKNEESQKLLTQARNVIESLQVAELNNFFREACVEANFRQIDQIDRTAAVIYPIILPDRLELILTLPNQPNSNQPNSIQHTTVISQKELEDTVEQVHSSLQDLDSQDKDFLPIYQKVYDWLIRPFESELANSKIKTLTFVLDGNLRNIPMTILHDGKQFLIEKYAIALSPGLRLVNPKPLAEIKLKALTAGLSEIPKNFTVDPIFPPLPNVKLELEQIKKSGLSNKPLLNEQFTTKELRKQIAGSRVPLIVHLATHGQFSSKVNDTFILSWDKRIDVKQLGNLLRNTTLNQGNPIELLVLSACETASGDKRAALGLAGVAVQAGARSTLATLWSVRDDSTAKIMGEFYHQLEIAKANKLSKAEALRQAQLILQKDANYTHPYFWAPFVMVGNWQ
ncbi:MAG: CHAT domain-containing protein [Rhizonema sp. PD38]|nr:CHAT domain-containing protein [Rhizonema sp. PD38]